jgi:hypothetical protein
VDGEVPRVEGEANHLEHIIQAMLTDHRGDCFGRGIVLRRGPGQGGVIGSGVGSSDEMACPACKKTTRALSVRTCLYIALKELVN